MNALEPIRTILFVPGSRPEKIDKALQTQADAVIIDLEDAVPIKLKAEARKTAKDKIQAHPEKKVFVRVNALSTDYIEKDIQEILVPELACIMVPKVENIQDMHVIDAYLAKAEEQLGLQQNSFRVIPLIETALAVQNIYEIVTEELPNKRLFTVAFGAADYALDMGIEMTLSAEELQYPRSRIAVACCAARLSPPIDSPFMLDLQNLEALEMDARRSKLLGYQGKLCIHPKQLDVCNHIYSPSTEEISFAHKVVEAFNEAEAKGQAALQVDGKFIDYPIVNRARKTVALAKRLSK